MTVNLREQLKSDTYVWTHLRRELGRAGKGDQRLRLMIAPLLADMRLAIYVVTDVVYRATRMGPFTIGTIHAHEAAHMRIHNYESYIRRGIHPPPARRRHTRPSLRRAPYHS